MSFERGGFSLRVNITLDVGERVALVAPSGQGKSTLIEGLAGLVAPREGVLFYGALDITSMLPSKRPMSLVLQEGNVFEYLSPVQNCILAGAKKQEILSLLSRVGLEDEAMTPCMSLSGGQRQRVGFVRALLQKKPFMLLDEPFSALDTACRSLCYEMIRQSPPMGLLFATHDPRDIDALATRFVTIKDGCVVDMAP